ncbi:MAG: hypothetical protein U1C46_08235 [Bacteroidales bacterium]|nr:hypothetical protein [Bacteroidales bacterium]MDZ4204788.1 hypothetical protein [Bacteroidales bacterium]
MHLASFIEYYSLKNETSLIFKNMKTKGKILWITLIIALLTGCVKDIAYIPDFKIMNTIPTNKYYSSDIMPDLYKSAYGNWKVIGTSGGFTGGGYGKDFDYLVLKQNGIFGIIRNDSLIAFGKMVLTQNNSALLCEFNCDKIAIIELCSDPEKYIQISSHDTLNLIAPCCDRYNIHLTRKK